MQPFGRILIVSGLIAAALGILIQIGGKIPWLGRLPGDFVIRREHFTFYVPLATCLLLSLVVTLLFRLFGPR